MQCELPYYFAVVGGFALKPATSSLALRSACICIPAGRVQSRAMYLFNLDLMTMTKEFTCIHFIVWLYKAWIDPAPGRQPARHRPPSRKPSVAHHALSTRKPPATFRREFSRTHVSWISVNECLCGLSWMTILTLDWVLWSCFVSDWMIVFCLS